MSDMNLNEKEIVAEIKIKNALKGEITMPEKVENPTEIQDAVRYNEQILTDEQKEQARKNIGAVSKDDITKEIITSENIEEALGYTPADEEKVNELNEKLVQETGKLSEDLGDVGKIIYLNKNFSSELLSGGIVSEGGVITNKTSNGFTFTSTTTANNQVKIPLLTVDANTYAFSMDIEWTGSGIPSVAVKAASGFVNAQFTNTHGHFAIDEFIYDAKERYIVIDVPWNVTEILVSDLVAKKANYVPMLADDVVGFSNCDLELRKKLSENNKVTIDCNLNHNHKLMKVIDRKVVLEDYEYCSVRSFDIENADYYITRLSANGENYALVAVTDENDDVIYSYSDYVTSTTDFRGCHISALPNAKKLYISTYNSGICTIYKDIKGKNIVYDGDFLDANFSLSANKLPEKYHNAKMCSVSLSSQLDITFDSVKCNTVGIWLRMSNAEKEKIESITVKYYNGDSELKTFTILKDHFNQIGAFFYKVLLQSTVDKISIIPNLVGTDVPTLIISECVIIDQFTRPYMVINYDQAWEQTNSTGTYDFLINNHIPFTITGQIDNEGVMEETQKKLMKAYHSGLMEIGFYGNEKYEGRDITDCRVSDDETNYSTISRHMENLLDEKLSYAYDCVSFGTENHVITPFVRRCVLNNGIKVIRYSTFDQSRFECFNSLFDVSLITLNEKSYNADLYNGIMGGSGSVYFAHGVSLNPSSETNPSLYATYSEIWLNNIKNLVDSGNLEVIRMRDVYERFS